MKWGFHYDGRQSKVGKYQESTYHRRKEYDYLRVVQKVELIEEGIEMSIFVVVDDDARCYGGPSNADLVSRLSKVKSDNGEGKVQSPTENGGKAVYGGLGGGGNRVILNALQVIKASREKIMLYSSSGAMVITELDEFVSW
ncbi:hypothetical protein QVD17_31119 [Tagetes erecta]|uniref:Uncharacterized protein n=1 Tax=Tagetes erecta TaxID=13708 RepID=A0AAD8NN55_TARER|nr:hypothetical protein QVD17_31119 [Tagetes erecta]